MKNCDVDAALRNFRNLGYYGFTQHDVNALRKFMQVDMNAQCSKGNMAKFGFTADQIARLDKLVKLVTQRVDVSTDEALQKHLAKLSGRTEKTNVRNFVQEKEVPMYGRIHDIPYAPWKLLNGMDGNGLTCEIVKQGKSDVIVRCPQVLVVRRGEPTKIKNVGELVSAEDKKITLRLERTYVDVLPCYFFYQATSIPTTVNAYLCLLRSGDKYYVTYDKVKENGKLTGSKADATIGFVYGDGKLSESLYKYALMSVLMREPGEGPKQALDELRAYEYTTEDSAGHMQELQELVKSESWKEWRALAGVINIKFIAAGQSASSFGDYE